MGDLWASVLQRVSRRVGPKAFRDWFEPTRLRATHGEQALVEVPNALFREWMERNYRALLEEALADQPAELEPAVTRIEFVLPNEAPPGGGSGQVADERTESSAASGSRPAVLDQRYTFDNFIVGGCNQFAHAAARAVADSPGRSYNPLFLYGGVGLGKTHLMQAIGHAMLQREPGLRMAYVSAERFMCEMINAIRWKRTPEFRDRYRNIDVLLVDDIQFLEGKEATQEEFFHTFRSLYEEGKQIVLSSDCPPQELATLEERLRSRFQSGLIADMQVPDLETKLAILRRKAEVDGFALDDEVALYVAKKVRSNVRELEGCLNRIMALASLRGREPDVDLAREATRGIFPDDAKPPTIEAIQRFVADYYNVKVSDLKARNNARVVAFPRQVAMFLSKKMTNSSFPEIGKKFGGKHHSTVMHSVSKIGDEAAKSQEFHELLGRFMEQIH